jgi:hypothetical protein
MLIAAQPCEEASVEPRRERQTSCAVHGQSLVGERLTSRPQTEDSIERGFRGPEPVDDELGRSESLDPDNVGDIADEGAGHRG